ncbi:MAG: SDR family oxidoreductase [Gammaproteobacteria bacterium]|nr:SDR family oxidoreductase [Gammaproteobacteria bacterium]MBI5615662.1 SDR family oxidoreductase [Gammaproteobacteria bacterium]
MNGAGNGSARRTALVTGASAGIGREFAREYARRGCDLVLTARREGRLAALADELAQAHGTRVTILPADLSRPDAPALLAAAVEARGLTIDILVNNAGYGVPGAFASSAWEVHAAFQQVMINAVAELCHRFVPAMKARGAGTIINVASLAGHVPGSAGHTLYGASKAWMIRFTESLAPELAPSGIRVLALCPGFTYSEFHDVSGMRASVSRLPRWLWMDAATVARDGIAAAERGEIVYITGRINRAIALAARLLPRPLVEALIGRHARDFRNTN